MLAGAGELCVCVEGGSAELKYTNLLPSDTN